MKVVQYISNIRLTQNYKRLLYSKEFQNWSQLDKYD